MDGNIHPTYILEVLSLLLSEGVRFGEVSAQIVDLCFERRDLSIAVLDRATQPVVCGDEFRDCCTDGLVLWSEHKR